MYTSEASKSRSESLLDYVGMLTFLGRICSMSSEIRDLLANTKQLLENL